MFPIDDLGAWLFKGIVTLCAVLISWLGWLFKTQSKKVDDHDREIAELKAQAVTEDKVREIVIESLQPMREDISEIKDILKTTASTVKDVETRMARQEGYQEALREIKTANGNG
jgi:septal ring factor EnvC (AmiA/AmiB activator)